MSQRCIDASVVLVRVGLGITLAAAAGCLLGLRAYWKTRGRAGSLVVPCSTVLTVLALMWFGTKYPFDHHPVIKASYALNVAPALCACFGLAFGTDGHGATWRRVRPWLVPVAWAAVLTVGFLVAGELWWI
jgi:hypothetical protein